MSNVKHLHEKKGLIFEKSSWYHYNKQYKVYIFLSILKYSL